MLTVWLDAICSGFLAGGDDLPELGADVVKGDVVVGGDARREPSSDELRVDGTATLLTVVVRARAAGEKAEALDRRELRSDAATYPVTFEYANGDRRTGTTAR